MTLTPANDNSKIIERNFGEDRGVYKRSLALISDQPLSIKASQVSVSIAGGLIDSKTTEVFPTEHAQVTFGAEIPTADPNILTINICIDPTDPHAVPPGQYAGTLRIEGHGIVPAQIPVTVTLKSAKIALAWIMGFIGFLLGIGVKVLSDHVNRPTKPPAKNETNHAGPSIPVRWISMLLVGAVLTIGVVIKLFYEPTTFGDSFANFWPIIVGSATATAGGTTVVDLFKGT